MALAKGLQAAGHTVLLATSERFRSFVEEHDVAFFGMSDAALALIETPDGRALMEGGAGWWQRIGAGIRLSRRSGPVNETLMRQTWAAAQAFGPTAIVFHAKLFAAGHVAEKLGIPAFLGALQPMYAATATAPAMGFPSLPVPGYNRLTYWLVRRSIGLFRRAIDRFRREALDLPPVRAGADVLFPPGAGTIAILHAYGSAVLPRPDDWPPHAHVTGYWRLEPAPDYAPPPELADFLDGGPAPVFIGFGSMTSLDPTALGTLVTAALRKAGRRGVVARGWAHLQVGDGDDVLAIDPTPYGWLFPRMAAVVHHGGAGTTAEGFHAGVPSVICPFFGDQPGWARLSHALGVGTEPVPRDRLTADRLAAAIVRATEDPILRENARALGARLRAEDGVARAVRIVTTAAP
ncbi:glycosyltransferase [Thalassobaculum sp. OXR-137]|nr:glycosyltransferase [Thalassobaculum sp. OXR-137]WPZ35009.1 glycosyltransferase [Thalassobaculum sp. OXR-137]